MRQADENKMPPIQMIEYPEGAPRVETGTVQFGSDWPGTFIRGDNAFGIVMQLERLPALLNKHRDLLAEEGIDLMIIGIEGLLSLLSQSDINNRPKEKQ